MAATSRDPELYAVVCLLSVLAVVGTAGNLVVLYVFSRPARRDRTSTATTTAVCPSASATVYIMTLAVADLVTCSMDIPSTVYMEWVVFHTRSDIFCKIYQFLIISNIPFSTLIIVAIAVDRYVCICHPLRHATMATACRARIVVVILAFAACLLGLLGALPFSVYHVVPIYESPVASPVWTASSDSAATSPAADGQQYAAASLISGSELASYETEETPDACANGSNQTDCMPTYEVMNTGYCGQSQVLMSLTFLDYFLVVHSQIYPISLVTVLILYGLIYRSVLVRRARRLRARGQIVALARPTPTPATPVSGTINEGINECVTDDRKLSTVVVAQVGDGDVGGSERQRLAAHIRTAAMLFVVTVVFVVTFAPAFLMSLRLLPYNRLVFYVYFFNSVANPVIYSFMNSYFRRELDAMFCHVASAAAASRHNFR